MAEAEQGPGKGKKVAGKKERAPTEPGPVRLRKAAARAVGRNCGKLAKVLMDKALEGHLESAKLLMTLAEPKKTDEKPKKKRRPGPTVREVLARLEKEPSWDDVPLEERKRILMEKGEWERYDDEVRWAEADAAANGPLFRPESADKPNKP